MLDKILPTALYNAIFRAVNKQSLQEIRLRNNSPVVLNVNGVFKYLSSGGLVGTAREAIVVTLSMIEGIIVRASEYSLYAFNEQIKQGYISMQSGFRIGICGEIVSENNKVITIKNINSLNIRCPHQVKGCASKITELVEIPQLKNVLIFSPPAAGKTTMLRDIARVLASPEKRNNVLIVDERMEIAAAYQGANQLDVGANVDVYSNCTKSFGFANGIRVMRPDIIITDELGTDNDIESVAEAVSCGVKIVASMHADSMDDLKNKRVFARLVDDKIFDLYVGLSNAKGAGTIDSVYDKDLNRLKKGF